MRCRQRRVGGSASYRSRSLFARPAGAADERKQLAFDVIERNARQMTDISDALFYFGELGMQEFESTKLLKDTLTAAGFKVELGGADMPTNFWAEYGSGRPKIAIVTEVDALPGGSQTPGTYERKPLVKDGPGHMEGHNTHGGVASLAAFAVKEVMRRHNIPGTVAIWFGPAEEQLASRPYLVRAGYFKDVDAILYLHIGDGLTTGYGLQNYAAITAGAHHPADVRHGQRRAVGHVGAGDREARHLGQEVVRVRAASAGRPWRSSPRSAGRCGQRRSPTRP